MTLWRFPGRRISRIDPVAETSRYTQEVLVRAAADLDAEGMAVLEEDLRSPCTEEIAVFRAFAETVASKDAEFVVLDTTPTSGAKRRKSAPTSRKSGRSTRTACRASLDGGTTRRSRKIAPVCGDRPRNGPGSAMTVSKRLSVFERYLTLSVGASMLSGVLLGKLNPGIIEILRRLEFSAGSRINVPIAVLISLMINPKDDESGI